MKRPRETDAVPETKGLIAMVPSGVLLVAAAQDAARGARGVSGGTEAAAPGQNSGSPQKQIVSRNFRSQKPEPILKDDDACRADSDSRAEKISENFS